MWSYIDLDLTFKLWEGRNTITGEVILMQKAKLIITNCAMNRVKKKQYCPQKNSPGSTNTRVYFLLQAACQERKNSQHFKHQRYIYITKIKLIIEGPVSHHCTTQLSSKYNKKMLYMMLSLYFHICLLVN